MTLAPWLALTVSLGAGDWIDCAPKVSLVSQLGGFSDVLFCGEERVRAIGVRFRADGVITGASWREYQGFGKYRNTQLYDDGVAAFVVHDEAFGKNFWKSSRVTQHMLFPRGGALTIRKRVDEPRLVVRDFAGGEWHLVPEPVADAPNELYVSMRIDALGTSPQQKVPIDFTERGIVGVDLAAAGVFFLQHNRGSFSGLADLSGAAYGKRKSVFRDQARRTCAVRNSEVYEVKDKNEVAFRIATDHELSLFLKQRCPSLDVGPLRRQQEQPDPEQR